MKKATIPFLIVTFVAICLASTTIYAAEGGGLTLKSPVDFDALAPGGAGPTVVVKKASARTGGAGDWEEKSVESIPGNPGLKHYRWEMARPPYGEFDRIALHRVVNKKGKGQNKPNKKRVILMLPGTWDAGGWSELTDPAVNTMLYLANNGYDVYTMSFRSFFPPNMEYEQFAEYGLDVSGAGDWTYGLFREDIKACVEKIKRKSKARTIFMSGFSRGALQLFIYASKYQEDLKGLIVFDGWFKKHPPNTEDARDEGVFNYVINLLKAGSLPVSPTCSSVLCPPQGTMYQLLGEATYYYYDTWQLAAVVPNALGMVGEALPPEFATVSDFVADDAQYMWEDGIFSNYAEDMIDRGALITAMTEFSRYWPVVQDFETWQLEAWDDVPYFDYDDNEVDLPGIAFLTRFFCEDGSCLDDTIPNRTVSDDATVHYLPEYGHVDIMFGKHSLVDVKEPLLQWLNDRQ